MCFLFSGLVALTKKVADSQHGVRIRTAVVVTSQHFESLLFGNSRFPAVFFQILRARQDGVFGLKQGNNAIAVAVFTKGFPGQRKKLRIADAACARSSQSQNRNLLFFRQLKQGEHLGIENFFEDKGPLGYLLALVGCFLLANGIASASSPLVGDIVIFAILVAASGFMYWRAQQQKVDQNNVNADWDESTNSTVPAEVRAAAKSTKDTASV